ncbi:tetratricopeptide repeat-containing sensor histidine kinase [Chryseobacterium paludis]|uniref:tetratricopeptide repeat-containing sensor histidine kinase n=1 Tax=Chryseobacterium paludis TaxID=2956784 RepID=UPI0021C14023|nr:tetratricopeptide repeat-containing sensor histidine kinase [Chryseobacterium paludis]
MKTNYLFVLLLFISCSQNKNKQTKLTQNTFYEKAWEFKDNREADSALVYFYKAKSFYLKQQDSIGAGKSLINIGIILTEKGDYFGAQETSLEATNYFDTRISSNNEYLKSNYNNLGIASYNLKEYDSALKFYNLAIKLSNNILDTRIYLNNKARALQDIYDYDGALNIYNNIFKDVSKNKMEYARTLTNLAKTKWLQNPAYDPIPELKKSLNIRLEENDYWGQNSSYANIADYYIKQNKLDSALFFANKMFKISKQLKSPDDQLEALQKLVISESPENSKRDFLLYQKLNDSIYIARSKSKNQFALIRYETEKNRADFLRSEAQNAQKEIQLLWQYLLSGSLITVVIIIIILYNRRQKRLNQEKELEIKKTQLKISKKVHDVVANGIYQVMTKIENQENFNKNDALDELEFVYEKSRDISYEKGDTKNIEKDFNERISELIGSFNNANVKTYLAGNDKNIWKDVDKSKQDELYQIIRELLVNMKKHSQAERVILKFEKENNLITIYYTDNGIGIPGDIIYKNGLSSTVSRIETINGEIIFDTKTEKGLKITISFPVS